jgi:hypothetical protein
MIFDWEQFRPCPECRRFIVDAKRHCWCGDCHPIIVKRLAARMSAPALCIGCDHASGYRILPSQPHARMRSRAKHLVPN